jgi:transcriptional regulator of acetoin/glycerol metabolism
MRSSPVKPPVKGVLGASPFFGTPSQRVALARERFFEEGHRPSGLVPEGVIQSWTRCVNAHRTPHESITFDPLTRTRISHTLARNRQLLEASGDDLLQLEGMLAGTACKAILTDRHGVVVHATRTGPSDGLTMRLIGRVGVDLAEETVGTTAPGVAAKTGALCTVQGAEHFFSDIHTMQCAAAPIRDAQGELAGVLDLSCEAQPFRFDAAAIVSLYATAIENRLLTAQSQQHVLLQFQANPGLLDTPLQGLAAIAGDGRVAWVNAAGASLVTSPRQGDLPASLEAAFGIDMRSLLALARSREAQVHRLPNGLGLWLRARLQAHDGLSGTATPASLSLARSPLDAAPVPSAAAPFASDSPSMPAAPAAVPRLHDANRQLIASTLAACNGNITRAARKLGVSRGLLYRRLKEAAAD